MFRALVPACLGLVLAAQERPVLVKGVQVFDGARLLAARSVLFHRGRILKVGTVLETPAGAEVIDGTGCTLLPGLVDAHTHTFGEAPRQALRFGVTTEIDQFTDPRLAALQKQADRADSADIRSAGYLATVPGGHGSQYLVVPTLTAPAEAQAWVDARLAEGSDHIKLVVALGRSIPSLSADTARALIQAAHARGRKVVVHAESVDDAIRVLEMGADGLAHVPGLYGADPAAFLKLAKAKGAFVIATLGVTGATASAHPVLRDPATRPYLDAEMRASLELARERPSERYLQDVRTLGSLKALGVPILCGTDAFNRGVAHGASMHEELERLVEAGFPPVEALAAATSLPCRHFGLADRGRIAEGLRADLLLVKGDPAKDILATRSIEAVWKAGVRVERKPVPERSGAAAILPSWDFEGPRPAGIKAWQPSTDAVLGGASVAEVRIEAAGGGKQALHVTGEVKAGAPQAWSGTLVFFGDQPFAPVSLAAARTLRLRLRGAPGTLAVQLFSQAGGFIPAVRMVPVSPEWTVLTLPLDGFKGADLGNLTALGITCSRPGPVDFWISSVAFQ